MSHSDVLIVGAGISGLAAARSLTKAYHHVRILEASDKPGGRISDIHDPQFPQHVMLGAEFIHGKLPLTIALLREAGIAYFPVSGKNIRMFKGTEDISGDKDVDWPLIIERLKSLRDDISLSDFLEQYFGDDRYRELRTSVKNFAKGFDAADPDKASAMSLLKEWEMEEDEQYRVEGGYGRLVDFMVNECLLYGCEIYFSTVVNTINWREGYVEVISAEGERFTAEKVIITVPAGVLRVKDAASSITFNPPLTEKMRLLDSIGVGSVVKIILSFNEAFWESKTGAGAGFIFSDEAFPTWWTQSPHPYPVLTGWMGGPEAERQADTSDEDLLRLALESLSTIFALPLDELRAKLLAWKVSNWGADPFSYGAYTYPTVEVPEPYRLLVRPVEDTIYFAGEAVYNGQYGGTVEAALASTSYLAEDFLHLQVSGS